MAQTNFDSISGLKLDLYIGQRIGYLSYKFPHEFATLSSSLKIDGNMNPILASRMTLIPQPRISMLQARKSLITHTVFNHVVAIATYKYWKVRRTAREAVVREAVNRVVLFNFTSPLMWLSFFLHQCVLKFLKCRAF